MVIAFPVRAVGFSATNVGRVPVSGATVVVQVDTPFRVHLFFALYVRLFFSLLQPLGRVTTILLCTL